MYAFDTFYTYKLCAIIADIKSTCYLRTIVRKIIVYYTLK